MAFVSQPVLRARRIISLALVPIRHLVEIEPGPALPTTPFKSVSHKSTSPLRAMCESHFNTAPSIPVHFTAGTDTGLGCGFLPFDSFFLSLIPMMISFGYCPTAFYCINPTTPTRCT
jgi:hypothetical protein